MDVLMKPFYLYIIDFNFWHFFQQMFINSYLFTYIMIFFFFFKKVILQKDKDA